MSSKLDQLALDIEFLLISVIQGVALAALASYASGPMGELQFEYLPYIISGFVIILIFWSQAIIHALSFIDWPIDLIHNFLYLLASLVEVIAFSQIKNPLFWFGAITVFALIAGALYLVDLILIKQHQVQFSQNPARKTLYQHILKEQIWEIKFLMPIAIFYNLAAFLLILKQPQLFIQNHYHLGLVGLQIIFVLVMLSSSLIRFKKRGQLIERANVLN